MMKTLSSFRYVAGVFLVWTVIISLAGTKESEPLELT